MFFFVLFFCFFYRRKFCVAKLPVEGYVRWKLVQVYVSLGFWWFDLLFMLLLHESLPSWASILRVGVIICSASYHHEFDAFEFNVSSRGKADYLSSQAVLVFLLRPPYSDMLCDACYLVSYVFWWANLSCRTACTMLSYQCHVAFSSCCNFTTVHFKSRLSFDLFGTAHLCLCLV